ncbi:MAG TPA: hypothetical protein PLH12_03795, partial [Pseudomonadales bacterium]|nr:hypothetical protein [Pseudomonadales bacterium]
MDNLWLSLKKHFFLLCCLGCAMPVLVAAYPPMVDLPQHAAQITALREFLSGNPLFVNLFNVSFFNPYWAAYIPIFFLSRWVGIVVASK